MDTLLWLWQRLRVCAINLDEPADRCLLQGYKFGLLNVFVNEVHSNDDRKVQVVGNERLIIPMAMDERLVSTSEEKYDEHDQGNPCAPGLERRSPWQLGVTVNSLSLASVVESQICDANDRPVDEGADGDQILQPRKNSTGRVGEGHVGKTHEDAEEGDSDVRDAETV